MPDSKAQILRCVAELAAQHGGVDVVKVGPQTRFIDDLNYDSLTMVEFVMAAEDSFKLAVPEDAGDQFHTVGQVADYIATQTAEPDEPNR